MSSSVRRQRKAKIVCTIGPSSSIETVVGLLIRSGMNVARLNFSHGGHDDHRENIERVCRMAKKYGSPVAVLQDLQGVKIRVGFIEGGVVNLKKGSTLLLMEGEGVGDRNRIFISYPWLLRDVKAGDRILLDDGLL
jgi:pyruvate kinase